MIEIELDASDNTKQTLPASKSGTGVEVDKQKDLLKIDKVDSNSVPSKKQHTVKSKDLHKVHPHKNSRVTTRIIRNGITAHIKGFNLFGFGRTIPVKLIDVSCKGVLIATQQKLPINKKITLTLLFETGKLFVIKAVVVRRSETISNEYGIKFVQYNDDLGDYLYETQEKLVFK
jgi:hypothetical protein